MNETWSEQSADQNERRQWATWLAAAAGHEEDDRDRPSAEPHRDAAIHLLDLVAAVDYLGRGHRDGLTVWDALEEALRWWTTEHELVRHGAPDPDSGDDDDTPSADPLKATLARFVAALAEPDSPSAADALLNRPGILGGSNP